jgi:hypothetical protein
MHQAPVTTPPPSPARPNSLFLDRIPLPGPATRSARVPPCTGRPRPSRRASAPHEVQPALHRLTPLRLTPPLEPVRRHPPASDVKGELHVKQGGLRARLLRRWRGGGACGAVAAAGPLVRARAVGAHPRSPPQRLRPLSAASWPRAQTPARSGCRLRSGHCPVVRRRGAAGGRAAGRALPGAAPATGPASCPAAPQRHWRPAGSSQSSALVAGRSPVRHSLTLAHGALDVAHDQPVLVVKELHADLGHLRERAGRHGCARLPATGAQQAVRDMRPPGPPASRASRSRMTAPVHGFRCGR